MAHLPRPAALLLTLALLAGCAAAVERVQRAAEGPSADDLFQARFLKGYGRPPTFDETLAWRAEFERRLDGYVARHPALRTSPRLSLLRVERRVSLGMSKAEVDLLGGPPETVVADEKAMQAAAAEFWPEVRKRAKEMWVYPGGWRLYFDEDRLVDLTVWGRRPLE